MIHTTFFKITLLLLLVCNVVFYVRLRRQNVLYLHEPNVLDSVPESNVPITDKPYEELSSREKIAQLLRNAEKNTSSSVTHPEAVYSKDKLDRWKTSAELYFDPRLTLAVHLHSVKQKALSVDHSSVPFSWSDWVDLTPLNPHIRSKALDCGWLQSVVNKPSNHMDFCLNLDDATQQDISETGWLHGELPGFLVKGSPMNKIPVEQSIMQAKSHLLTYAELPISIMFLAGHGAYRVGVSGKEKLLRSAMFEEYMEGKEEEVVFNPSKELAALTETVPVQAAPTMASKRVLSKDSFQYSETHVRDQIDQYEVTMRKNGEDPSDYLISSLTPHQINHYSGLKCALATELSEEPTYYKLATLIEDDTNKDNGWHYEWRFFNGTLWDPSSSLSEAQKGARVSILLERLLRNWFKFSTQVGVTSWIAHGPLLSWFWNGMMFPYDIDIDIQMPITELNRLTRDHNMTLVVEDPNEGFGRYLLQCSTYLHHRDVPPKDNFIDARFIDMDSGMYIDITGLGVNQENPPPHLHGEDRNSLYMDRRTHWIQHDTLSPLRKSMLSGVPVYVPNDVISVLKREYAEGTISYYFGGYYYVPGLRLWVSEEQLKPFVDKKKMASFVSEMDQDHLVRLLETNPLILEEFARTHKLTWLHEVEKHVLFGDDDEEMKETVEEELNQSMVLGSALRSSLFDHDESVKST